MSYPKGTPRIDLFRDLHHPLGTRVHSLLYRCRRDASRGEVEVHQPGRAPTVVRAIPAPRVAPGATVLHLLDRPDAPAPSALNPDARVAQLERDLLAIQEDLRNTVEELQSSNEELRASNEESMSMNEELQSANEELE